MHWKPSTISLYPSPIKQNSSLTYLVPALTDNWFKKQKTTVNMKINKIEKQKILMDKKYCLSIHLPYDGYDTIHCNN